MPTHDRASTAHRAKYTVHRRGRLPTPSGGALPTAYSTESNRTYELHQLIGKGGFGVVQSKPGGSTDVLVRGLANVLQIAGARGGLKVMEIKRLAARGHVVKVIGDRQFWRLVKARRRRTTRTSAPRVWPRR